MRSTFLLASLLALACGSTFASVHPGQHLGPTHTIDSSVAVNPQPLPPHGPRPGETASRMAVNPQPLPPHGPRPGEAASRVAVNPQPLPPHGPRPGNEAKLAGGDPSTVVDIRVGRIG